MPATDVLHSVETNGELQPFLQREWLLTNGLGSFASSSVLGCNTRRYHGTLCAATTPPVGRVMSLSRIGETLYLDGDADRGIELSVNQFREALHPRGDRYLRTFELGDVARWTYDADGVRVVKEQQLLWQRNVAGVRYTVDAGRGRKVRLDLSPFTALRDFHGLRRTGWGEQFDVRATGGAGTAGASIVVTVGSLAVSVLADARSGARFTEQRDWWYAHVYPIESERGMDDAEDLFSPGRFTVEGETGRLSVTLWVSPEPVAAEPDWDAELARRAAARAAYDPPERQAKHSPTVRRLFRAAEDFVVERKAPDGSPGTSILAGYPWFADWGRDTFIALPGLLLTTGRLTEAKQVLSVFGQYVSEGMIPNRFDDYTSEPSYNTVDASLWYVHAAFEYLRLSDDRETFDRVLRPACRRIIDGYKNGTRFHIRMEPDGLVTQGDAHTQLTWMDAKCDGIAFTPRQGKAVEINALWYHALVLMGEAELAAKVAESFRKAFWVSPFRGLADVVSVTGERDAKVRPNQIFAASLPNSPLTRDQQSAVVELVRRELLTPMGLRTLAKSDPQYHGRYTGTARQRDEGYHNGAVWAWPIGAFLSAYLRVNDRSPASVEQAKAWLQPLVDHMGQNCVGQIAEIFEGDAPHRPVGCPAQAWSVAEVLRLAVELGM